MKHQPMIPILIISTLLLGACGAAQLASAPRRDMAEPMLVEVEAPVEGVFYAEDSVSESEFFFQ